MMFPFEYPSEPHQRRHGPKGYADAASYSPWLRDEFSFRCVYCLKRETWTIRKGEFVVENTGKIDSFPFLLFPVAAKQFRPAKIGPSRSTDESRTRPVDF